MYSTKFIIMFHLNRSTVGVFVFHSKLDGAKTGKSNDADDVCVLICITEPGESSKRRSDFMFGTHRRRRLLLSPRSGTATDRRFKVRKVCLLVQTLIYCMSAYASCMCMPDLYNTMLQSLSSNQLMYFYHENTC